MCSVVMRQGEFSLRHCALAQPSPYKWAVVIEECTLADFRLDGLG
jgi:hypothetical protein